MPEGPEVTIIAEGLNKLLKDKYISLFEIDPKSRYAKKAPDGFLNFDQKLPIKIKSKQNKGKLIYWTFAIPGTSWRSQRTLNISNNFGPTGEFRKDSVASGDSKNCCRLPILRIA